MQMGRHGGQSSSDSHLGGRDAATVGVGPGVQGGGLHRLRKAKGVGGKGGMARNGKHAPWLARHPPPATALECGGGALCLADRAHGPPLLHAAKVQQS
jgi:hypothetical protein